MIIKLDVLFTKTKMGMFDLLYVTGSSLKIHSLILHRQVFAVLVCWERFSMQFPGVLSFLVSQFNVSGVYLAQIDLDVCLLFLLQPGMGA